MASYPKLKAESRLFPRFALFDGRCGRPLSHAMSDGRRSLVLFKADDSLQAYRNSHDRPDCPAIRLEGLDHMAAILAVALDQDVTHVTIEPNRPQGETMSIVDFVDSMHRHCAIAGFFPTSQHA